MNLRCRKPRPLTREDKTFRDDRLFIIATEDTFAPERYFQIFKNPRIKVRVLATPRDSGLSAPEHVIKRLDEFVTEYELMEDDERWLMLDTDHWLEPKHIPNFVRVCTEAMQKGYQLAHSNPCFEYWLLLHITDMDPAKQLRRCKEVKQLRENLHKQNNTLTTDAEKFTMDDAAAAIQRAEKLDTPPSDRWPQQNGSHVYKVVKKLLSK
jgi:hypothetical protein